MRLYILAALFAFTAGPVIAQNAITIQDSVIVKQHPREDSNTVVVLPKGYLVSLSESVAEQWVLIEQGWVKGSALLAVKNESISNLMYSDSSKAYVAELLSKNPADLTQQELYYLMYQEQKKEEALRRDIKTIKNVQLFYATVSAVSLASSIVYFLISR